MCHCCHCCFLLLLYELSIACLETIVNRKD
nr:MAG TPA: hypothetical protein [Caudoviricetes sp.]